MSTDDGEFEDFSCFFLMRYGVKVNCSFPTRLEVLGDAVMERRRGAADVKLPTHRAHGFVHHVSNVACCGILDWTRSFITLLVAFGLVKMSRQGGCWLCDELNVERMFFDESLKFSVELFAYKWHFENA